MQKSNYLALNNQSKYRYQNDRQNNVIVPSSEGNASSDNSPVSLKFPWLSAIKSNR
jgi:hypothetical protein